jgi:hypothetical protein
VKRRRPDLSPAVHPHDDPAVFDAFGRCLVCARDLKDALQTERDSLLIELAATERRNEHLIDALSWAVRWVPVDAPLPEPAREQLLFARSLLELDAPEEITE